nr:lipid A biosynthesis acyltransferase [Gammaproteobacteria bacterium]
MTSPDFQPSRFMAPRYWGTWIALGLLRLLIIPPYRWQVRIGAGLGWLLYVLGKRRRRITETNIAHCFPEHNAAEQKALVKRTFRAAGIAIPETALAWWGKDADLTSLVEIEGMEHLQAALEKGKGVLLLGAHFTSLEISGRLLALFHPCYAMYRRHDNPLFEAVIKQSRETHLEGLIERRNMRHMIRTLRKGDVVWYAPDQDFGTRSSVFAP